MAFKSTTSAGKIPYFFFYFINAVDFHLRHAAAGHGHYNPCFIADQLEIVAVARHDIALISVFLTVGGKRADNIVRLKALKLEHLDVHSREYLFKRVKLNCKLVGHSVTLRLVFGIQLVTKGFCTHIKRNGNHIGLGYLKNT